MRLIAFVAALASLAAAGCGDKTPSNSSGDLAMSSSGGDLAPYSLCGHPGDSGNSKGVGKYCTDSLMCSGNAAFACSTLMSIPQGPIYFCTLPCDPAAANPDAPCGENSSCTCLTPSVCGCVPTTCRVGLFG